jgi:hypothetical protein
MRRIIICSIVVVGVTAFALRSGAAGFFIRVRSESGARHVTATRTDEAHPERPNVHENRVPLLRCR